MALVCGVDCTALGRPNRVAWLEAGQFTLDSYIPTRDAPLPVLAVRPGNTRCVVFDAPQGLPAAGAERRRADWEAGMRTRRLPANRDALGDWKPHRALIALGVSVFWWAHRGELAGVAGLGKPIRSLPTIAESCPPYVIRRLWPSLAIPSKRSAPLDYVDTVYSNIQKMGYRCRSVIRPTVEQVDAMLCALAAAAYVEAAGLPAGTVGAAPTIDETGQVLRDGYIISG